MYVNWTYPKVSVFMSLVHLTESRNASTGGAAHTVEPLRPFQHSKYLASYLTYGTVLHFNVFLDCLRICVVVFLHGCVAPFLLLSVCVFLSNQNMALWSVISVWYLFQSLTSTFIAKHELDYIFRYDYFYLLLLIAGCAQCQQRHSCQHPFGRTVSRGCAWEKTLVMPLATCSFSVSACLNYVINVIFKEVSSFTSTVRTLITLNACFVLVWGMCGSENLHKEKEKKKPKSNMTERHCS